MLHKIYGAAINTYSNSDNTSLPYKTLYHSLEKTGCEKIFIGQQVQQKLNTQKFSYHKEIEQFINYGLQSAKTKIFYHVFFLMNISNH